MLCIVIRLVCNSFPIFKTYFTTFLGYSVAQMPRNIPVFSQKTGNSAFLSASSCISLCTCFPKGNQCVSVVWMIIFLSTLGFLCHNFHPYAFRRPFSNPRPSFPFSANCSCLQRTLYWDVGTGDFYATIRTTGLAGGLLCP